MLEMGTRISQWKFRTRKGTQLVLKTSVITGTALYLFCVIYTRVRPKYAFCTHFYPCKFWYFKCILNTGCLTAHETRLVLSRTYTKQVSLGRTAKKGTSLLCYPPCKASPLSHWRYNPSPLTSRNTPHLRLSLMPSHTPVGQKAKKKNKAAHLSGFFYSGTVMVASKSPKMEAPYKVLDNEIVLTSLPILNHMDKLWDIVCKFLLKVNTVSVARLRAWSLH